MFNPCKTLGGERNKIILSTGQEEQKDQSRDDAMKQKVNQNSNSILWGLEKMLKGLNKINRLSRTYQRKVGLIQAAEEILLGIDQEEKEKAWIPIHGTKA